MSISEVKPLIILQSLFLEIVGNSEICLEFVYKISEILRADFKIQGPYIYACE